MLLQRRSNHENRFSGPAPGKSTVFRRVAELVSMYVAFIYTFSFLGDIIIHGSLRGKHAIAFSPLLPRRLDPHTPSSHVSSVSRQKRLLASIRKLETARHELLENLQRIILGRCILDFLNVGGTIAADGVLVLVGIVQILKFLECVDALQIALQSSNDFARYLADLGIVLGATPSYVEEKNCTRYEPFRMMSAKNDDLLTDIVIRVPVQTQDVRTPLQALVCKKSRKGLELDGCIDEEILILVLVEFLVEDLNNARQNRQVVGECDAGKNIASVCQLSLHYNVPTDLSSGGALSSPVRDVRLASRSVLNTGGPIGEVGANSSNSGDGKLLGEKPFPVTSPVYSYKFVKESPGPF